MEIKDRLSIDQVIHLRNSWVKHLIILLFYAKIFSKLVLFFLLLNLRSLTKKLQDQYSQLEIWNKNRISYLKTKHQSLLKTYNPAIYDNFHYIRLKVDYNIQNITYNHKKTHILRNDNMYLYNDNLFFMVRINCICQVECSTTIGALLLFSLHI